jgi:hypothetical protein
MVPFKGGELKLVADRHPATPSAALPSTGRTAPKAATLLVQSLELYYSRRINRVPPARQTRRRLWL